MQDRIDALLAQLDYDLGQDQQFIHEVMGAISAITDARRQMRERVAAALQRIDGPIPRNAEQQIVEEFNARAAQYNHPRFRQ